MIASTEGIVLHTRKYSDTSSILTVYTREHGKIGLMVKGARRPKSKFGSNVMPLSIAELSYYFKVGRELHTLSGADSVASVRRLTSSYEHLSVGLSICEAVMLTQPPAEKNAALYELLRSTLIVLNDVEHNTYSYFVFFCIHLAEIMGFMIDLHVDDDVALSADGDVHFSFDNGAPLHDISMPGYQSFRMRRSTLQRMEDIASLSVMQVQNVALSEAEQREIQHFFVSYFSYHLDKRVVFRAEHILLGD